MNPIQAELARPQTEGRIPVQNPANREVVGTIPSCSAEEISAAVERARATQPRWAATPVRKRLQVLRRFQQLLCEQKTWSLL